MSCRNIVMSKSVIELMKLKLKSKSKLIEKRFILRIIIIRLVVKK